MGQKVCKPFKSPGSHFSGKGGVCYNGGGVCNNHGHTLICMLMSQVTIRGQSTDPQCLEDRFLPPPPTWLLQLLLDTCPVASHGAEQRGWGACTGLRAIYHPSLPPETFSRLQSSKIVTSNSFCQFLIIVWVGKQVSGAF